MSTTLSWVAFGLFLVGATTAVVCFFHRQFRQSGGKALNSRVELVWLLILMGATVCVWAAAMLGIVDYHRNPRPPVRVIFTIQEP